MIYNIDWPKTAKCTALEREAAKGYIDELIDLKHCTEKDGIKSLQELMHSSKTNSFEKAALDLIIQGYAPELCSTVMSNLLALIAVSTHDAYEYLRAVIFAEFLLMLQKGESSDQYIRVVLSSFLGPEAVTESLEGNVSNVFVS